MCRDELKGVKTANRDLRIEKDNLENQLFEHKSALDRLEKQKDRLTTRPKEDVALVTANHELKAKLEDANKKVKELTVSVILYIKNWKKKTRLIYIRDYDLVCSTFTYNIFPFSFQQIGSERQVFTNRTIKR